MRVYIGPYVTWWGPYQIAGLVPFLSKDTKNRLGEWLSETWVGDFLEWVHDKRQRRIKIHIDDYDTWNMDHTLAFIILPMLKQLKESKHGSPLVDDEDVPEYMRHDGENWVHYKWEWVLNEMIWAFETHLNEAWEDQFRHGDPVYSDTLFDDDGNDYQQPQITQTNPDYWVDIDGLKAYNERIDNGFRLFGTYYRGLWD